MCIRTVPQRAYVSLGRLPVRSFSQLLIALHCALCCNPPPLLQAPQTVCRLKTPAAMLRV